MYSYLLNIYHRPGFPSLKNGQSLNLTPLDILFCIYIFGYVFSLRKCKLVDYSPPSSVFTTSNVSYVCIVQLCLGRRWACYAVNFE